MAPTKDYLVLKINELPSHKKILMNRIETNLKRLHTAWFQLHGILEKVNPREHEHQRWPQALETGVGTDAGEAWADEVEGTR